MKYKITRLDGAIEYRNDSNNVLPAGATALTDAEYAAGVPTPIKTLAQARVEQLALMEMAYTLVITAPIVYMAATFQADLNSQDLLDKAIGKYTRQGAVPTGFWWKDLTNNHVAMTLAQLQGLGDVIGDRLWPAFQNLDARKAAIRSATTVQQVQGVVW